MPIRSDDKISVTKTTGGDKPVTNFTTTIRPFTANTYE